jgi:dipeptidyl-peptidase-4
MLGVTLTLLLSATTMSMSAQEEKKLFTLEDLNYGGKNYRQMSPENRYYEWKGEIPVRKENWEKPETNEPTAQREDDHQLYVTLADGTKRQLTTDGSREIVYGEAVHRNEFGIEKGIFWSPDKQKVAFYRMDQSMVTDYPQVDIFKREATYEPDKYPMAGERSHEVTVGVYDLQADKTIYLKTPVSHDTSADGSSAADNLPVYFTNIAWSPDGKRIYMFELNRDQNDCRLVSYDATTGERLQELYRETHEKYVEPLNPIVFLPWDSSKFLMQSRKDGYNHLYIFEEQGTRSKGQETLSIKQLTSGKWEVMELIGFNKKEKSVIIAANATSPIQRNLFAVNTKSGKIKPLDNGRGWHYGKLSETGETMIDSYSEPDVPRKIVVTKTATGKSRDLFTAKDPWEGYQVPGYLCGTIKAADGVTDLYYRMVVPAELYNQLSTDTEGHKLPSYPTVVYVYGGPHAHNVDARWHYCSRSWETYMAQKGYIVFILDNRGSENRGRDFEQATFRQLGQVEMQDQMKGVEFLKSLPYVDTDRIGVHGWSFGGFMTISLMTNYPDVFKVGVAGGPVIDWKWYEVMYGERYMDTPQQNPDGYEKTSLIPRAKDLKGKLQIITGYNDETVVPQHCLSFLAECIKEGTHPDFFVYPGEPHNMRGHQSVHLHERITQYFEDYLK